MLQIGVRGGGHMVATIGGAILSAAGAIAGRVHTLSGTPPSLSTIAHVKEIPCSR